MRALHEIALHFGVSPKVIDKIGQRFQLEICEYYRVSTTEGYENNIKHEPFKSYEKRMRQVIEPLVVLSKNG